MPEYIAQATEKILTTMNQVLVLTDPNGGGAAGSTITMRPCEVQRWRFIDALAVGKFPLTRGARHP